MQPYFKLFENYKIEETYTFTPQGNISFYDLSSDPTGEIITNKNAFSLHDLEQIAQALKLEYHQIVNEEDFDDIIVNSDSVEMAFYDNIVKYHYDTEIGAWVGSFKSMSPEDQFNNDWTSIAMNPDEFLSAAQTLFMMY